MPHRRPLAVPLVIACCLAAAGALDGRAGETGTPDAVQLADITNPDHPYKIAPDGTVDWATYNGYRRYNSICETCHGFDGTGSSFGPRLVDSLKTMSYEKFVETVASGKKDVSASQTLVMPALGTNPNVMCYIDDIYTYLKARANGALGRGRPAKHEPKPQSAVEAENSCMGSG